MSEYCTLAKKAGLGQEHGEERMDFTVKEGWFRRDERVQAKESF